MTVAESTAQKNNPSGGRELIHVNGDDLGNPGLSHGDAVQHFGGLHRLFVVGDQDKLRVLAHFFDHIGEAVEISVIERRIDLVEKAERARLGQEDREKEAHGGQGLFSARKKRNGLQLFARWLNDDVDPGLEEIVLVRQHQPCLAAAKEAREDRLEFLVDGVEALFETQAANAVELDDGLLQVGDGSLQIFLLLAHETKSLGEFFVLADRRQIHFAHALQTAAQIVNVHR